MTQYQTIIFDLDGTLIHSAPDLHAAANVALEELGRRQLSLDVVTSFIGNGVEKLVERSLLATGKLSGDLQARALAAFLASYNKNVIARTQPYSGVIECLSKLKAAGVPLGICTNKPTAPACDICEKLGLAQFFDVIVGAESGIPRKPDPRPLLETIERLGTSPAAALYVGDSEVDYMTARNAGVVFRLYSGGYLKAPIADLADDMIFGDWTQSGI